MSAAKRRARAIMRRQNVHRNLVRANLIECNESLCTACDPSLTVSA